MIALLTGRLVSKSPGSIVVDVGGVGYLVSIPLSTFYGLPEPGGPVTLHIHTHVREDAISLYGFLSEREKRLFLALTGVSGVGPKLALGVISGLPVDDLIAAISSGDDRKIATIPGIGPKTAARVALELKDKAASMVEESAGGPCAAGSQPSRQRDEAVSALVNLGYRKAVAEDAVKKACATAGDMPLETLIREVLKVLAKA